MTDLEDLPPSAKLVFKVLEHADEPLTHAELREETRLSDRTTRFARHRLEDVGMVEAQHSTRDARQCEYSLTEDVEIIAT